MQHKVSGVAKGSWSGLQMQNNNKYTLIEQSSTLPNGAVSMHQYGLQPFLPT